jgi:hypothetical protein
MLRNDVVNNCTGLNLGCGGIFDCVILVATSNSSSPSGHMINDSMVAIRISNLAADPLSFAVLGQSSGSIEVPKALLALKFLLSVSR